jgi:hypothetical protein
MKYKKRLPKKLAVNTAQFTFIHLVKKIHKGAICIIKEANILKNKIIFSYLLLLVLHIAHVFEEVWAGFWLIQAVYGLGWFLVANWILFCIPVMIFYFVLQEKRWAYYLSFVYAGIMVINGIGHNIAVIVTGRYFNGFAGGYTGIGLLLVGLLLIYFLWQQLRKSRT